MKKKKQHGGARKGAGRKKGEEKKRMWIPVSQISFVESVINSPPSLLEILKEVLNEQKKCLNK